MRSPGRGGALLLAGLLASALLAALYARGAWALGFVALVPWLLVQARCVSWRGTLLASITLSIAFVAAVFGWFAPAIADYTGWPPAAAFAALLLAAPLLQPQFLAFALARRWAGPRFGPLARAAVAIAAWLAAEWALPRLFGDTLGHGLHPSLRLRQFAEVGGAAGLTLALLVANEAVAAAIARRRAGPRALAAPLALALAMPALLATHGALRLSTLDDPAAGPPLRIGLVQASIVDYEGLRRAHGAYAVVRHVLDTHYALSRQARAAGADALVWSETVYPTTFMQPRSADGAALDAGILAFVRGLGAPLVFGTYARDDAGEYNVAAFVNPQGALGAYRKTRLFPLTEYVPPALDGPALRRALPWAGTWAPGDGARVFPLRLPDGREVPVAPLICRDDVDPRLALAGARLGAQLIVGLSNDAWFTRHPEGARLHLAVAAFRSIETRLPQVRATTNGTSAVIDPAGTIVARTRMGERRVLLADVRPREAAHTPMLRLGPWPGPVAALVLLGFGAVALRRAGWRGARAGGGGLADAHGRGGDAGTARGAHGAGVHGLAGAGVMHAGVADRAGVRDGNVREGERRGDDGRGIDRRGIDRHVVDLHAVDVHAVDVHAVAVHAVDLQRVDARAADAHAAGPHDAHPRETHLRVLLLAPWQRIAIAALRLFARAAVLALGLLALSGDEASRGMLRQVRQFAVFVLAPELAACALAWWATARARIEAGELVLHTRRRRIAIPLRSLARARPWRLPLPSPGLDLWLTASGRWPPGLALRDPLRFVDALQRAGANGLALPALPARHAALLQAAAQPRRWYDRVPVRFLLFPLVPALPAFRLHQHIAHGGTFGEYYTFGAGAWLGALGLWWASWAVALVLLAGGLRAVVDAATALTLAARPAQAPLVRARLLAAARLAYYLGVPGWLALRLLGG